MNVLSKRKCKPMVMLFNREVLDKNFDGIIKKNQKSTCICTIFKHSHFAIFSNAHILEMKTFFFSLKLLKL